MKKRDYIQIAFYILIIIVIAIFHPVPIDWSDSFDVNHERPYGLKVLYELLPERPILIEDDAYSYVDGLADGDLLYINTNLDLDEWDFEGLYDYAAAGHNVMLVTEYLPDTLENLYDIYTDYEGSFLSDLTKNKLDTLSYFLNEDFVLGGKEFKFVDPPYNHFIVQNDSIADPLKILGVDAYGNPCFAEIPVGNGHLYIHTVPMLFTNYFLLRGSDAYVSNCLAVLDQNNLHLDQAYLPHVVQGRSSPLSVLLQHNSMKWAYWLGILTLLLYFIFRSKRNQRVIPILDQNQNSSHILVDTIGRLYYNEKDHRNLGLKMAQHFKAYLHDLYGLKNTTFMTQEIKYIADRSGFEPAFIASIFNSFNIIESRTGISSQHIRELRAKLNKFYNHK